MIVLAIALFMSALMTTVIFRQSAQATIQQEYEQLFGTDIGVIYNADPQKIQELDSQLTQSGAGRITVFGKVQEHEQDQPLFLGQMDENATQMRFIRATEGRLPEKPGELAIEQATYHSLNLDANIGDTVILPIRQGDDTVTQTTFTLVGILGNYLDNFQRVDGSKNTLVYRIPVLLTVQQPSDSVLYTNILLHEPSLAEQFGGEYVEDTTKTDYNNYIANEQYNLDFDTMPILVFFVIVMIFGISSIIVYTIRERQHYLKLLRCLGMNKGGGTLLIVLQGMALFLVAAVLSIGLSLLFSYGIYAFLQAFGKQMLYAVAWKPLLFVVTISGITTMAMFIVSSQFFLNKRPLETGTINYKKRKKTGRSTKSMGMLWKRTSKRGNKLQHVFTIVICAACLFVTAYGSFMSVFAPRVDIGSLEDWSEDYNIGVRGGTSNAENFHLSIPRKTGISQKDLDDIYATEGLSVNDARIYYISTQFFVYDPAQKDPRFDYFMDPQGDYRVLSEDITPQVKTALQLADAGEKDVLVQPYTRGMDYHTAVNTLNILDGEIDREKFLSGEGIIADQDFKVGESFTMVTPILKDETADPKSDDRFDFVISHPTVMAVYDNEMMSGFVISGEYMTDVDPDTRYSQVSITNENREDPEFTKKMDQKIERIVANSSYVLLRNIRLETEQYIQELRQGQIQTAISIIVFVTLIILAILLSTYVKVRSNMRSYILLRAIGADNSVITRLVRAEVSRLLIWGGSIGTLLGYATIVALAHDFLLDTPVMDLFALSLASVAVVFGALWFFTKIIIRKPCDMILEQTISEKINAVEL